MNKTEERWLKRLERCIKDMPTSLEMSVLPGGMIYAHHEGDRMQYLSKHGHTDNVPEVYAIQAPRIYPSSESL